MRAASGLSEQVRQPAGRMTKLHGNRRVDVTGLSGPPNCNRTPRSMAVLSKVKQFGRDLTARAIAPVLRRLAHDPKYFELWQRHGFHITGVDYYQPIPDTRALPPSLWDRISDLPGVDIREE